MFVLLFMSNIAQLHSPVTSASRSFSLEMFDQVFSRPSKEQLYMLECLVHELKIFLDNVIDGSLYVSLKFARLPIFVVNQQDFSTLKDVVGPDTSSCHSRTIHFQVGKSCLFSSLPDKLKCWIQEEPLKISVHKVVKPKYNQEGELEEINEEDKVIAGTDIFLANCNSDFATENFAAENFSQPKSLKNCYHLRDLENRPFGSIKIFVRLSCFGNLLVTKFSQSENSFIFKTGHSLNEFECGKVPEEESSSEIDIQSESSSINSSHILGLSLVCEDLVITDGGPKLNVPAPEMQEEPTKTADNRFKQENFVVANEPKPCLSETNCPCFKILTQDCVRSSSCCETKTNGGKDSFRSKRMRGGACQPTKDDLNDNHVCGGCNKVIRDDQENRNTGVCCFQKSIEEAQQILNSLGNKSGFAGLGILGHTESPYFGRKRDQEYNHVMKSWREEASLNPTYAAEMAQTKKQKRKDKVNDDEDYTEPFVEKTGERQQLHKAMAENVENLVDDRGISTMYHQKEENFGKPVKHIPKSRNNKGGKRKKRNKFGRRKKIFQVKSFNSSVMTESTVSKPLLKPSRHIMKHAFAMREYNPGIYYGHRNCLDLNMRIPANMGWLWNTCDNPGISKPRYGWKPGAISKHVYHLLMKAKSESGVEVSEKTPSLSSQGKKVKSPKSKSLHSMQSQSKHSFAKDKGKGADGKESELPPLVQIQRKDGDYYVTINPVRQADPNAKPLQLKISKNEEDDNASNSTAPDFNLACSAPMQQALQNKVETKDMDTQVKQQEILDSIRAIIGKTLPKAKPKKPIVKLKK